MVRGWFSGTDAIASAIDSVLFLGVLNEASLSPSRWPHRMSRALIRQVMVFVKRALLRTAGLAFHAFHADLGGGQAEVHLFSRQIVSGGRSVTWILRAMA